MKVKAPFVDEISGLAIIKILDGGTYSTLLIKLKFAHNRAILDIMNKGKDTMILRPKEMTGILNLRSLGYYKLNREYYNNIWVGIIDWEGRETLWIL